MSTPTTTTKTTANFPRDYNCPKDGCPPVGDPDWVYIFILSCTIIFFVTLIGCAFWWAYIKRRERRPPQNHGFVVVWEEVEEDDVEMGRRLRPPRPHHPPDPDINNTNSNSNNNVEAMVVDVGGKAAGLGYKVEAFKKSTTGGEGDDDEGGRRRSAAAVAGCSICLEEFKDGEDVGVVTACRHFYHKPCLEDWLKVDKGSSCPLCRAAV